MEKGLSFVPKPPNIKIADIIADNKRLVRDVKIKSLHKSQETTENGDRSSKNKKFLEINKNWEPGAWQLDAATTKTVDLLQLTMANSISKECKLNMCENSENHIPSCYNKIIKNRDKNNITREEKNSLKELKSNKNIIIKPADKGGATVIMDVTSYEAEAHRQLENNKYYREIPESIAPKNVLVIRKTLDKIYNKKLISLAQLKYLSGPPDYSLRNFYLLPKIHKDKQKWPKDNMPEGRPIVSDTNSESSRVAEYIDHFINPLSIKNFSYVKNSYDFVEQIRNTEFDKDCLLVTGDVKSLYTNMDIDRMVKVTEEALRANPDQRRPDKELIDLLEFTLKNNDFQFGEKQYLQTCGTAMGKRYAPALANLYLKKLDLAAVNDFNYKPERWKRFLDDIFFIWRHGTDKLKEFEHFLNNLIPGIEITFEYNKLEIPFLDVLLYVHEGTVQTKTYFKPTDTHQLLHAHSYHPKHTCKGILKSQFIRFKKLSSNYTDYHNTCNTLYHFLQNRGYTASTFRKLKYQIWFRTTDESKTVSNKTNDSGNKLLPVILSYSSLNQRLALEYKNLIKQNESLAKFRILAAFKIAPNLKQILVRSKFGGGPKQKQTGKFYKCNSIKCIMCIKYSRETSTIKSTTNGRIFSITDKMTCNSCNLIYLIHCGKCQTQYIGETGRTVKDRLNDHCSAIKTKKQTAVAIHFNSMGHSEKDLNITAIEQLKTKNIADRRDKEKHWIKLINSAYPHGLNNWPI